MSLRFLLLLVSVSLLPSCSEDKRTAEISGAICACFEPVNGTISEGTRKLLRQMNESANPDSTYRLQMAQLGDSGRVQVARELSALAGLADTTHPVGRCLQDLQRTYWRDNEEQVDGQGIRRQMLQRSGCELAAFIAGKVPAK